MMAELPEWPRTVFQVVADAAACLLPNRASLNWSPPTETDPFWHLALTPKTSDAAELHFFVDRDPHGIDNFETASRASSFELWEPEAERLVRVRQVVDAVTGGHCVEEIHYAGDDAVNVKLRLGSLEDEPTTYNTVTGRPRRRRLWDWFPAPERLQKNTFGPY